MFCQFRACDCEQRVSKNMFKNFVFKTKLVMKMTDFKKKLLFYFNKTTRIFIEWFISLFKKQGYLSFLKVTIETYGIIHLFCYYCRACHISFHKLRDNLNVSELFRKRLILCLENRFGKKVCWAVAKQIHSEANAFHIHVRRVLVK